MKYSSLIQSYGNVRYPNASIFIESVEIKIPCKTLNVSLSMKEKASAVSVQFICIEEKEFLNYQKEWKIGDVMQCALGYAQKKENIFLGYLHSISCHRFKDRFEIELYAQDVLGLMMNHQRLYLDDKNNAQKILEKIIKDQVYKKYIKSYQIMKSEDELDCFTQWENTDFETIKTICKEKNMRFYMSNDTFVVEKKSKTPSSEITFSNYNLEEISLTSCCENIAGSIEVFGRDKNMETLSKTKNIALSKYQASSSLKNICHQITCQHVVDNASLDHKLDRFIQEIEENIELIHFKALYVPELLCGCKLNFSSVAGISKVGILTELEVRYDEEQCICEGEAIVIG